MGLACMWSSMMRGNLGRHGKNNFYKKWEKKYGRLPAVKEDVRTQGLIEKHNDSVKNVYLDKKNDRLDAIIRKLYRKCIIKLYS